MTTVAPIETSRPASGPTPSHPASPIQRSSSTPGVAPGLHRSLSADLTPERAPTRSGVHQIVRRRHSADATSVHAASLRSDSHTRAPGDGYPDAFYAADFTLASHPAVSNFVTQIKRFGMGDSIVSDKAMYLARGPEATDSWNAIQQGSFGRTLDPDVVLVYLEPGEGRPDVSLAILRRPELAKVVAQAESVFGPQTDRVVDFLCTHVGQAQLQSMHADFPLGKALDYGPLVETFVNVRAQGLRPRDVPSGLRDTMRVLNRDMSTAGVYPPANPSYFDVEGAGEVANRFVDRAYRTTQAYERGHADLQQRHPEVTRDASIYLQSLDRLYVGPPKLPSN